MQHINTINKSSGARRNSVVTFYATAHPVVFEFEVCNMFSFHSHHHTFIVIFF